MLFCLKVLAILFSSVSSETLLGILETKVDVSQFYNHLLESKITALSSSTCKNGESCVSVLAPTNTAWMAMTPAIDWPSLPLEKQQFVIYGQYLTSPKQGTIPFRLSTGNWQQLGTKLNLIDVGFGTGAVYVELAGPRYAFSSPQLPYVYFINDAKVVEADITATNGIIQIMDRVVYYPQEGKSFYEYLQATPTFSKTLALWKVLMTSGDPTYTSLISQLYQGQGLYATYFVVPDAVWSQLPADAYNKLLNNRTLLIEVLAKHYAPNQLFYARWCEDGRQANFYVGFPANPRPPLTQQELTPGKLGGASSTAFGTISLANMYAQALSSGVALRRAVLIEVSAPLGYLYEKVTEALSRLSPLFVSICNLDTACRVMLQSPAPKTVFAPLDAFLQAFSKLPDAEKTEYLALMIIPERILRPQMTESKYIAVGNVSDAIRFRTIGGDIYVEARRYDHGYVGAALTAQESSGSDGIVYQVNAIPGMPTKSVREFLAADTSFTEFLSTNILDQQTKGAPYTYFVPTNEAVNAMKADTRTGAKIFADQSRLIYVTFLIFNHMNIFLPPVWHAHVELPGRYSTSPLHTFF
uniref:FAS1 domain-containing protein n=1 Tax=Schistocephalus solidus TaxID=70667 RepID=A0A0X3NPZ5_SCHSO